ncbi:hypothetical protein DFH08DRAFT_798356 [Mycena albidolilacea]|uniref:Uncharacterized protein n=1 Tax=Mycena albidolilacea TaxID=1033008 RepID=A0AAD7F3T2_9AGAR|nr:hypothetical protein DFH08DRAFT_798356 [Mycena albidolilacea]
MAPQIRLLAVEQEEKILLAEEICKTSPSVLAHLPDAPMLAILAEAHAPDEHPAHQGHTPVLYRLSDAPSQQPVGLSEGRQSCRWPGMLTRMVHQGPMHVCLLLRCKQHASHSLPACGRAGRLLLAWPSPSRTYASRLPAPALQAAYFPQSVGLSEGSHPTAKPGGCLYTPPTAPHFFFMRYWADCSSWERRKFWVLGRGPHAAIEMRKGNPRQNDTGKEGEVLVQPNPTLTETGSKVEFQHRDGGLGSHGGVRREDDKQRCWGCRARSRKHGKIIEVSGRLQEQTEGGQHSWTHQYALRIGSHGGPALARCDMQPVFLLRSAENTRERSEGCWVQ